MDKTILDDKKAILATEYVPQYEQLYVHPEDGEHFALNEAFEDIYSDMKFLDTFLIDKASGLKYLMNSIVERLDNIDLNIKSEQERLQDIKMLCNKFTDFDNVIPITQNTNLSGVYSVSNDTFSCEISSQQKVKLMVYEVTGNGIEGNKYVYKDFAYVQDSVDTSNRQYLIDDSVNSYYEYERITASSTEPYLLNDFNTDNEEAKCTLSLYSEKDMNLITIQSDDTTVSVIGVQCSDDGVDFEKQAIPEIKINNKTFAYEVNDYVCGDNKIQIPESRFAKLTFQSSGVTDDVIAYDRVMFWHELELTDEEKAEQDAEDGVIGGDIGSKAVLPVNQYNNLEDATVVIQSAKRHSIKLNDISAWQNQYRTNSYFKTGELISDGKFYSVSLFANVYLPYQLDYDDVQFVFTINGIDYVVTPVNAEYDGNKIFRYSQGKSSPEYTVLLAEPITSVLLTVRMNGTKNATPLIGNIKVLLGGEI
jgi:hypothetical protein